MKTTMFLLMVAAVGCAGTTATDGDLIAPGGGKSDDAGASACTASKAKIETAARKLMGEQGLIRPGEETDADFAQRWGLDRVEVSEGTCLAVMEPCYIDHGENIGCEASMIEVVAYDVAADGEVTASLFEDAVAVPAKLHAGLGNVGPDYNPDGTPIPGLSEDLYYVELAGNEAVSAMKSVAAKVHYCGLVGLVIPGGAASFDPTPDRTWRVVSGRYDLRRGNSHEVGDIRPAHWDGAFDDYFGGAIHREVEVDGQTVTGAEILPWAACFMRRYEAAGRWIDVIDAPIR